MKIIKNIVQYPKRIRIYHIFSMKILVKLKSQLRIFIECSYNKAVMKKFTNFHSEPTNSVKIGF